MIDQKDAISLGIGGGAVLNPIYLNYLETLWQAGIALGGAVIIYLTIRNKLLDMKIKKLQIEELKEDLDNG